jgi:hypothetical protein
VAQGIRREFQRDSQIGKSAAHGVWLVGGVDAGRVEGGSVDMARIS